MKRTASDLSTIRTASDLSIIQFDQFRLIFKGHKSLEYCCLVIHLTSVSTISYAESNGGILSLLRHYKYKDKRSASDLSTIVRTASDLSTIQFRLIFKGHKSLEYWCLVIHLTSVSTISYAESNGVAFFSKYKAAQLNV